MNNLTIGKSYALYTKFENFAGVKVEVIGIITYEKAESIPYNMKILALNERVINVNDEDLKKIIDGDNIYWLKNKVPKADGTYDEYLVWDGIINFDKTTLLNESHDIEFHITINDNSSYSLNEILNSLSTHIKNSYPSDEVLMTYSTPKESESSEEETIEGGLTKSTLEKAESIINSLNKFESKLIPAAEQISGSQLLTKLNEIESGILDITTRLARIKNGL